MSDSSEENAYKDIAIEALDRAANNKASLKAMHQRLDEMEDDIKNLNKQVLTEDRMKIILEQTFNAQVVRALKHVIGWSFAVAIAGVSAWVTNIFGMKQ